MVCVNFIFVMHAQLVQVSAALEERHNYSILILQNNSTFQLQEF